MTPTVSRRQVLGFRVRAQQLDRAAGTVADTAVLDLGVQDTGADGGRWALALRGVDVAALPDDALALAWTLRGAPHLYRRADIPGVAAATQPFSEADAAKRVFDAAKPLHAAGIPVLTALDEVAAALRSIVTGPMVKGDVSGRLNEVLPAPYLRECRPCNAVHVHEQPFRLAALRAGLELEEGTSPPVLRPVPGPGPAAEVPAGLDVVRGYLRLLGPATRQHVAGYLDAPVKDVAAHWPADAAEVTVDGERRWVLAGDVDRLTVDPAPVTRLLGPFDLFLQARDRALVVPDGARAKELWRVLGRPGGVLADGEVVGTWRARKARDSVSVAVELWAPADRAALHEQAERLAAFRGLRLGAVEVTGP
ncbi:winged helix DNA-binding domain-containing protein [Blastococcus sp. VKM Ac-2987]|uniref:winged helix DNA-binding domain-containing protein n=1 Tax=Blastococcus sp. VKM Ac-2987 TaxID=3004141 RepID=UPI0022AB79F7|nr:winged helix DNA-binding domain-containing protein [Blastococcus sp. VKM Ac-2987]MCZ2858716.1 winged helix DNA-binding domain-containing protein [Blastococcus sp. VKM Ac-2987]